MLGTTAFASAPEISVDMGSNMFIVKGSLETELADKNVKLIVINPEYDIADIKDDNYKNAVQSVMETQADEEGAYEFRVPLYNASTGEYKFYIQTDESDTPVFLTEYYADSDTVKEVIEDLNNATEETIEEKLLMTVDPLNLKGGIFDEIDVGKMKDIVYQSLQEEQFDADDAEGTVKRIRQLALLYAYNEGMETVCFDSDDNFKYADIFDFSAIDTNNVTLYNVYETIMSDNGKAALRSKLLGWSYTAIEELEDAFCELVFVTAVNNANKDGTGHIQSILTDANAEKVGVSVEKYTALSDGTLKSNAENYIMRNSYSTPEQLADALDEYIDDNSGNGGGGGGSGTGNGSGNTSSGNSSTSNSGISGVLPTINELEESKENEIFSDIDDVEWAKEAIIYLYNHNIINGMGDGRFEPQQQITREQFIVMLVNAMGLELTDDDTGFGDVVEGSYYEKHIAAAVKNGITTGIGDGLFGVGEPITRQDLCVMVYRAMFNSDTAEIQNQFTDRDEISEYAQNAVDYMAEKGIVNGFEDGTFGAKQLCTRAQAAKILYGVLNKN